MAGTRALEIARSVIGQAEGKDRAALTDYLKTGGANLDPATTAWCAAFVNATLAKAGMRGTGSNMARSFLDYGSPVETPAAGDIAVYRRGDPKGPYGHVGFVESVDPRTGTVNLLAGNQGNAVTVRQMALEDALGYRRPVEQAPQSISGIGSPLTALPAGPEDAAVEGYQRPMPFSPGYGFQDFMQAGIGGTLRNDLRSAMFGRIGKLFGV